MASHIIHGSPRKKTSLSPDVLWDLRWGGWAGVLVLLLLCSPVPGASHAVTGPFLPTVSEPQAAHSPVEKPPGTVILCHTCGNVCKGEVLRVQNKHFHIKCFVCKGEHL